VWLYRVSRRSVGSKIAGYEIVRFDLEKLVEVREEETKAQAT